MCVQGLMQFVQAEGNGHVGEPVLLFGSILRNRNVRRLLRDAVVGIRDPIKIARDQGKGAVRGGGGTGDAQAHVAPLMQERHRGRGGGVGLLV